MIKIRKAKTTEIKKLVDSFEEMDVVDETFSEEYYKRILKKGILLVAEEKGIVGVCFGTFNEKERWADLLGLVVKKEFRKIGAGSLLVKEFEKIAKNKKLKTIDLYADKPQVDLFKKLNYTKGRTLVAFRKVMKWKKKFI